MKRKILIGIGVLCFILACFFIWRTHSRNYHVTFTNPHQEEKEVKQIKVGTYNTKLLDQGNGLERFANEMKELDLDILVVQEVDQHARRSGNINMVEEMAKAADFPYYHFYQTMWILDGYYGIGILSKYPINAVTSTQLPTHFLNEPRVFAQADIDFCGRILHVYHTHLSFKERDVRKEQIASISKEIENQTDTIFLGDMNTFQASDFFEIDGMTSINKANDPYITFRDFGFPDNIYYSNNLSLLQAQVIPSTFSDHNLFYCELKLS